jgi:hypothetical protein
MKHLSLLDSVVFDSLADAEVRIEEKVSADVMYFYGVIQPAIFVPFRNFLEHLATRSDKRDALAICLKTPGGSAETTEMMAQVIRHHYKEVYFIVADQAYSAGTILCMSGDKIYMDYSSGLGPIDPQVLSGDQSRWVPALGYLDKVEEFIEKSRTNQLTPAEFELLARIDLGLIRSFEEAKDLSIDLIQQWLVRYKFKDWVKHRTNNKGGAVTLEEKKARALEIATALSAHKRWHSHGRMIGMNTLRQELRLDIDDFGTDTELQSAVRRYNDTLSDYLSRSGTNNFMYNRHVMGSS